MKAEDRIMLIRVDATKEVALGHLKRCISLARKFRELGVEVFFLTAVDKYTKNLLEELGFKHIMIDAPTNSAEDVDQVLLTGERLRAKIIIIDSYDIDNKYRNKLIDQGFFVVSISDNVNMEVPANVIVNGSLNAEKYYNNISIEAAKFLGIKYLILNENFGDSKGTDNNNLDEVRNVLITMGGIDHYDLTTKILKVLEEINDNFDITVVIGPYYENINSIQSQVSQMHKRVNVIDSSTDIFNYMKNCTLAFSAGGQTLYELAALGRPTVGISLWENQADNVTELSRLGAIYGIAYSDEDQFHQSLTKGTLNLFNDGLARKRMSAIAASLVDGKGADRVSTAIVTTYQKWINKK